MYIYIDSLIVVVSKLSNVVYAISAKCFIIIRQVFSTILFLTSTYDGKYCYVQFSSFCEIFAQMRNLKILMVTMTDFIHKTFDYFFCFEKAKPC